MVEFFQAYFLDPIRFNTGYNIVNTAAYAIIFVALVFATYRLLKLLKIKVDKNFFIAIVPYIALAQSIGRIGCFLNGCCYGVPSDSFPAVIFPGEDMSVHPVQIYLSLTFLALFVILKKVYEKNTVDGVVFVLYLAGFSLISFFMDFLRGDLAVVFLNLKVSQIISLVILLVSLVMLVFLKWKTIHSR